VACGKIPGRPCIVFPERTTPKVVMDGIELAVDKGADEATLRVGGEIDLTSAPKLDEEIQSLIEQSVKKLTLDLSSVAFMDSTGLRVLLKASKLLEGNGGKVVLREPSEPVRRLLEVSGLDGHFDLA
jgi:anti-anti-sigma factor